MKKTDFYLKKLSELGKEILDTLLATLKERGIKSINLYEYWSERNTERYTFYDTDEDGYGVALFADKLYVTEDGIELEMLDTDDCARTTWDEENLSPTERYYILTMVEQILEVADSEDNGKVLTAEESFDEED